MFRVLAMRPSDNWTKWLAGFAAVLLTDCVPFEERERERERKAGREKERERMVPFVLRYL